MKRMYEKGDYEIYNNLRIDIDRLEKHLQISWQQAPGDYAKLNMLRRQANEMLRKMNGRKYDEEVLKPLYE